MVAILDALYPGQKLLSELVREVGFSAHSMNDAVELHRLSMPHLRLLIVNAGADFAYLASVFKQFRESMTDCLVLVIVEEGDISTAVRAIQLGAVDVMAFPINPKLFKTQVTRLVARVQARGFVCKDLNVRQLLALSERVAQTDVTVLLGGESGTGKEVLAKHIHECSTRNEENFVAVNCASIPETMLEDMLFGHEKGAFTGAHQRHIGLFEQATRGTLFLDEVGEIPLQLQAKLLRVLQEKELKRLGGTELIRLNTRVIAATNKNLREEVSKKNFREDLYYRLNVFPLQIPPLRERPEDILPIAESLLKKHQQNMGLNCQFGLEARQFLAEHYWPGNVRELENVVQRALVLTTDGLIGIEHLLIDKPVEERSTMGMKSAVGFQFSEDACVHSGGKSLNDVAWERERQMIVDTLARLEGSRKQAAEELGISPRTLRYKIAKLKDQGVVLP